MRSLWMPTLMAVPLLAGCPSSPQLITGQPLPPYATKPMMYPTPMPMMTSAPTYPGMVYPVPTLVSDGPSLDDAYHLVQRYVAQHYPESELVAIRSTQVGPPGRIARAGSWSFTFRAPASDASSSARTQAIAIPSQFEGQQLTFKLNGQLELFAPEVKERTPLHTIDFARTIPLSKALEACLGYGMAFGPGGVSVNLLSDAADGPYYEIDNGIGYQLTSPSPSPYGSGTLNQGGYIPAYVRAKYRIDALTGDLIERMSP